jgi:NAD(P)H-dependent FMN reductase
VPSEPLNIAVIVGSTREGRFGPTVADWIVRQGHNRRDMTIDLLDLADADLPAVYPRRSDRSVDALLARLGRADGFVVVTPEYNHGYPASLKQAIDLANHEWRAKPVAFVSYGGLAGGLRAVEQLRQVFAELHAMTVRDTVSFHLAHAAFDTNGEPLDATGPAAAAKTLFDQLAWWADSQRTARAIRPYAA